LLPLIGFVFCATLWLPVAVATIVGVIATVWGGVYSLRVLCRLVSLERVPRVVRDLLDWCRITPRVTYDVTLG
jgi:hypothetical protein